MAEKLTNAEIALYDRQIRLWGMEAQQRMRAAKILLVNLSGVGTEVAKNLVLGGIGALTVLDAHNVVVEDLSCQFFQTEADVGSSRVGAAVGRIQELNNRVVVAGDSRDVALLEPTYFAQFDIVIATELSVNTFQRVNDACRALRVPFYAAGLHGLFGYVFVDLIAHTSVKTKEVGKNSTSLVEALSPVKLVVKVETKTLNDRGKVTEELVSTLDTYTPLSSIFTSQRLPTQLNRRQLKQLTPVLPLMVAMLAVERPAHASEAIEAYTVEGEELVAMATSQLHQWTIPVLDRLQRYAELVAQQAFCEFSPVAAILGGSLAQDVITMLAGTESPINNFMVLDGTTSEMPIFYL